MKKIVAMVFAVIMGISIANNAFADSSGVVTANAYLSFSERERGFYVIGFVDGHLAATLAQIPIPEKGSSYGQLIEIINKYIKEHPEERHYPMTAIIIRSMQNAFSNDKR